MQIQKTVNHSPIEDAKACIRLFKVFAREIGIYPVKMVWNAIYGSKEARYEDPPDIKNIDRVAGPYTDIMKQDYKTLGEPGSHIAVGYSWGINEMDERELLRVSIINELGNLVFDSII